MVGETDFLGWECSEGLKRERESECMLMYMYN